MRTRLSRKGVSQPKVRNLCVLEEFCENFNQESRCVGSLFIWRSDAVVAICPHKSEVVEFKSQPPQPFRPKRSTLYL